MAGTDLDAFDAARSIESSEGLDVNHASRARIQFLAAQSNAMLTQTQFADAKAAALLTVSALLALQGPASITAIADAGALMLLAFALNAACIGACFFAIVPRFPGPAARAEIYRQERYSWPGLVDTHHDEAAFPDFMCRAEASQLVLSLARANQANARILHRKFAVLRFAFLLGILGLAALGLHGLAGTGA